MKQLTKGLLVFGFTSTIAVTTAFSQLSFDENGNATGPGATPGFMSIEPISGVNALTYILPFGVLPGDLVVFEGTNTTVQSELIRFQGNRLWFFSEIDTNEATADLADVGIPPAIIPPSFTSEVGSEGNNGFVWAPGGSGAPGDPGFAVQYNFISDVPEPGTAMLVGVGLVGLLAVIRGRK